MAILHVDVTKYELHPESYDEVLVPRLCDVFISRGEGLRFRLHAKDNKQELRFLITLKEGRYGQQKLLELYLGALQKRTKKAA